MKCWFAYRFVDLPFIALEVAADTESYVVVEKQRIVWASAAALEAGAEYHMDITTAQLLTDCEFFVRSKEKESKFLAQWMEKFYEFSPHIQSYTCASLPHAGLLIEVSTCLGLFGGVMTLRDKIATFVSKHDIRIELGVAHTSKASWLLTFADVQYVGNESRQDYIGMLHQLPISLLHDFPSSIDALEKTGFNTLGDVAYQIEKQTISGIKKRFGQPFTHYLCELFDIDVDFQQSSLFSKPVPTHKPIEFFAEHVEFDYPTSNTALMEYPIECLLQKLSGYLRKNQLEAQKIEWTLSDIRQAKEVITVFADSPQSHWQLFYDLTMIQLEHKEFSFEVDTLALLCAQTSATQSRSQVLVFDTSKKARSFDQDFAITAAKLKARLGDEAVFKLSYKDALVPEESQEEIALNAKCNQELPQQLTDAIRPTWLMPEPIPIEVRSRGLYWRGYLNILIGPERIHGNWLGKLLARDYFVAARHDQMRLWIFKDLSSKTWFVHGIFG